eukprot:XP_014045072.1 PREDICTED: tyrosine-protein phosphatase non-receptor type 1-like isoform X1 [Salmo salar]
MYCPPPPTGEVSSVLQLMYCPPPTGEVSSVLQLMYCPPPPNRRSVLSTTADVLSPPPQQEKCAQYWPTAEGHQLSYTDTGFVVTLVKEEDMSYYVIRVLELRNTETGETREIYHFHYTTWPDFGVPESPASFLNFLVKVRESGSLGPEHGPSVVHCSAGIGRSGTFSLVDTCLILMDKRKDPSSVDIQKVLLDMREYRMGLIQTPDQLRFSYRAVLEGAKSIMGDCSVQVTPRC